MFVDAESGTFVLRTEGFGVQSGLPGSANVSRQDGFALVTINFTADATAVEEALEALYGAEGLFVVEDRTAENVTYTITTGGDQAGLDFPQLRWGETRETTGLVADLGEPEVKDGAIIRVADTGDNTAEQGPGDNER